jgi:hypothetical protein
LVIALWGNEEYWQIDNNAPELHKLSQRLKELYPSLIVIEASAGSFFSGEEEMAVTS